MNFKKAILSAALAFTFAGAMTSAMAADPYVRPLPTNPVTAGKMVLGSAQPVIAVPLVGETREAILKEAQVVKGLNPDLIEVRADYWDFIEDTDKSMEMLREIDKIMDGVPMLLTVRIKAERGHQDVSQEAKFGFYEKAIAEKLPALIDVELAYGQDFIKNFKKKLEGTGIALVVAHHDMKATPKAEEIKAIMEREIAAGGDVAKIVVKPNCEEDVLTFLNDTLSFRRANPSYPIIASGSGDVGRITRLIGGLFGIDLTFASGVKGSNPTQMPVATVREANAVIYPVQK